jgi:hypothetical protein
MSFNKAWIMYTINIDLYMIFTKGLTAESWDFSYYCIKRSNTENYM